MNVRQCYAINNSVCKQLFGAEAVTATDLTGLVSLGNSVLATNSTKERYLGVLSDRIGKTILRTLPVVSKYSKFMIDKITFGAAIQKINIAPFEAKAANYWKVGEDDFKPQNFDINKPTVTQKIFSDINTYEFDVTVPDRMLEEAFTSETAMQSFFAGIMDALTASVVNAVNTSGQIAVINFIGEKIHAENGVVNLLSEYNTAYGLTGASALTADKALTDAAFLKFSNMTIAKFVDYLAEPSYLYNTDSMQRSTSRDNLHVLMLTDYVAASKALMQSDTFNKDLVELPMYDEFTRWQGTGTTAPTFANTSKIDITTSSGASVSASGIVGVLADRMAIFTMFDKRRIDTDRNNHDEYTNYCSKVAIRYANDLGENGIIFVIQDPTT